MGNSQIIRKQIILIFTVDNQDYALYISNVERVVPMAEITTLPKAPQIVQGVVNFHGEIIPVIDMRSRFNLPFRETALEDRLIIVRTSKRLVAIIADSVTGTYEFSSNQIVDTEQALPYTRYLSGVVKKDGNLILISDLDKFLSLDEEKMLGEAIGEVKK